MLNRSSAIHATVPAPASRLAASHAIQDVEEFECPKAATAPSGTVDVVPRYGVTRRSLSWIGMSAETVRAPANHRVDYRFRSPLHLLAAYEQGERRDGESFVEGASRSTLRDIAGKLTFVPAGREYHEWHDPRTPICVTYLYFDPTTVQTEPGQRLADLPLSPRLLFEDATIWSTAAKLRQIIDMPHHANKLYVDALGVILLHELANLERRALRNRTLAKGGLAAWQQRIVSEYIEEHLSEQISIATLAQLARLSSFHFCRAFKRSFGVPPHRYHTGRRVARAKMLLAERKHSVTEVGMTIGFAETSSFTAMFRKFTGQTPSDYHRALG